MKQALHLILFVAILALLIVGCTGKDVTKRMPQPTDTLYTKQKAMDVYDYQPERALQIVDSAVIVGNISEVWADGLRARIYSWTLMGQTVDSLLHGPEGVRFDSARVIGERLLLHDSLKANIGMRQDVLEVLVYVARQQQDTARWLRCSQELVEVCHLQGEDAEPEALRTEAEMGAVLCMMGRREQGMARLDSVIAILDSREHRQFNWLDASVIAMKRKMSVLNDEEKYIETIPLARRIIDRLDDYERHPQDYHDGTYREPADSTERADYINFYRTQMQSRLTAAYAAIGEQGSMQDIYEQIEQSVRDVTAREHIARYHALEQQMLRQEAESRSRMMTFVAVASVSGLLVILLFTGYLFFQKRRIQQKNRVLAQQLTEFYDNTRPESAESSAAADSKLSTDPINPEDLYHHIRDEVNRLQLYTDPGFGRQSIIERFHLTKDQASRVFSQGSEHSNISSFINDCRLDHARRLLVSRPDMAIGDIATASGFGVRTTFTRSLKAKYGITPTEFREQQR